MDLHRLAARQRLVLALSALALLVLAGAFQCATLALAAGVRDALTAIASGLSVLCVAALIDDLAVRPLGALGAALRPRTR